MSDETRFKWHTLTDCYCTAWHDVDEAAFMNGKSAERRTRDGSLAAAPAPSAEPGLRAALELVDRWESAATLIDERSMMGDPAAAMAQSNVLRACSAALRAALTPEGSARDGG